MRRASDLNLLLLDRIHLHDQPLRLPTIPDANTRQGEAIQSNKPMAATVTAAANRAQAHPFAGAVGVPSYHI